MASDPREIEEVSEMDSALLMSLLDESQGEERDDERLRSVIRSLEAEIYEAMEPLDVTVNAGEDAQMLDLEEMDSIAVGCLDMESLDDDLEFMARWVDKEDTGCSSPSDDMNWHTVQYSNNEMDACFEFEGVIDYSQFCFETTLEEHGCSPLWQEPCYTP